MTARPALLLVLLPALAAGCAYNPGYFPYYFPGGRTTETHAKPGSGVFSNFDPKACKIEVTPQNATAPLGSQIVLVATVYDKDGQPRRSRRVEWILEGPGNIVEVDESGVYSARGYKVDNKYAVSHTNYLSHCITRGNDDPKDDINLAPGQTFCVISSAVPGETTLTAYAPGVFNWDQGRTVVKIAWGEGRFGFPAPAVVRYGGETTLTTTVRQFESDGPLPANYRVRYKIIETTDDAAAVLVSRGGSGTTGSQSGTRAKEAEAVVDADGAAAVRLLQPSPKPGKTRVAVEVVKPPENGIGPGIVVGRRETTIEWAAPSVNLDIKAPPTTGAAGTVPVTVSLVNAGAVESSNARVRVTLSDGATLDRSEPPPTKQDAAGLQFDIPASAGGKKQDITLQVKPRQLGAFTVSAEAVTADGFRAENKATTRVEQGKLQVLVEAPPTSLVGDRIPVRIAVTNPGAAPAENVVVWARFDDALTHAGGKNPAELSAGTVSPGQTKTLDLTLSAKTAGRFGVRASATADGNVTAAADPVAFDVRRAELAVGFVGPKLAYLNQPVAGTLTVANPGDATVSNINVRATLAPELRVTEASDNGRVGVGSIEWKLAELRPGERRELKITAGAMKLTDRALITVVASGDALTGTGPAARPVGDPVEAKAEVAVAVIGTPAVGLELVTPKGVVEAGKRVAFQVRVKNQGTVAARGVEVTAFAPPELKPTRGTGPSEGRIDATGTVTFPPLDELRPGETVTFTIEVDAIQAGDARFRAEVKAMHLANPLKEEQSVRVIGGR